MLAYHHPSQQQRVWSLFQPSHHKWCLVGIKPRMYVLENRTFSSRNITSQHAKSRELHLLPLSTGRGNHKTQYDMRANLLFLPGRYESRRQAGENHLGPANEYPNQLFTAYPYILRNTQIAKQEY